MYFIVVSLIQSFDVECFAEPCRSILTQESRRGRSELLPEHGDERARAVVPGFQGRDGHLLAGCEHLHGVKEAELLAPPRERHARLLEKEALDRSLARAAVRAQFLERPFVPGVG